jgi:hypothetical protein
MILHLTVLRIILQLQSQLRNLIQLQGQLKNLILLQGQLKNLILLQGLLRYLISLPEVLRSQYQLIIVLLIPPKIRAILRTQHKLPSQLSSQSTTQQFHIPQIDLLLVNKTLLIAIVHLLRPLLRNRL